MSPNGCCHGEPGYLSVRPFFPIGSLDDGHKPKKQFQSIGLITRDEHHKRLSEVSIIYFVSKHG